jgi:isocitrate lyase
MNALISEKFGKDFKERKMLSYVETIQREEGVHNVNFNLKFINILYDKVIS